jgi:hypothetical protein
MTNANTLTTPHIACVNRNTCVDSDPLLLDVVSRVKNPALREFMQSVLHEPEILQALTAPVMMPMSPSSITCTYPIQALRRAGEMAAYWCACGAEERDALYVATILQGAQKLLEPVVLGSSTAEDVMFTLARKALHRLDDQAPRCSRLLRLSLGWGCEDDIDDFYVPRLQIAVRRALNQVSVGANVGKPVSHGRQRNDKRSRHSRPQLIALENSESCQV